MRKIYKKHIIAVALTITYFLTTPIPGQAQVSSSAINFLLLKDKIDFGMVYHQELKPFYHGVASGDPLSDKVVIWTRVTPENMLPISVDWQVAGSDDFSNIVRSGNISTDSNTNYTVKIDVDGLSPGTTYYYRFMAQGKTSVVGRTQTTPVGDLDQIKIGVVTGSNYQWGIFNNYANLAKRSDLAAFIHTGDYFYEYESGEYAHPDLKKRDHYPNKELVALDDYRKRYSQYRLTMPLQALHQNLPILAQWDDHEFANDAWRDGAENHDPAIQGSWETRRNAALQAYYEWMPVREPVGDLTERYQKVSYGDLLDLFVVETRMQRDEQLCAKGGTCTIDPSLLYSSDRTMLGATQKNWLLAGITSSTAKWKLLSTSVMMGQLFTTDNYGNMDSWDGYPVERDTIYGYIKNAGINNFGSISGDYHTAFVSHLVPMGSGGATYQNYLQTGEGAIGFEFTAPSITTANFNEQETFALPDSNGGEATIIHPLAMRLQERSPYALGLENYIKQNLKHIKYANVDQHGYAVIEVRKDKITGKFYYSDTILQKSVNEALAAIWSIPAGTTRIQEESLGSIHLQYTSTWHSNKFDKGAAEIVAFDSGSKKLFVTNSGDNQLEVLDISSPDDIQHSSEIPLASYGAGPNSVAVHNGIVAVAVEAAIKQAPGKVVFFRASDNTFLKEVVVGALPDMLVFTPDGNKILVANEGEPDNYETNNNDPEGTISIIDLSSGVEQATVATADFTSFNSHESTLKDAGVRIFGPNATVAEDLEPEYVTVSSDSSTAWVSLQENNAIAKVDIASATVTDIYPLGYKDHSHFQNGLDGSDKDNTINIRTWDNLLGMYQPDSISTFSLNGKTYLLTANEGDARDYDGFNEEVRVEDLTLDTGAFPNADTLKTDNELGRLTVTSTLGDTDGDGDYDRLYSFGSRSFSIFEQTPQGLEQVYDSGDMFEKITAAVYPEQFNSNDDDNTSLEKRSDNKGPEPEGITHGDINGRHYAFIGLERIGGIMVYEISKPEKPIFVQYLNNRDFSVDEKTPAAGDLSPEGLLFIHASDSPNNKALLISANEVSGTVSLFTIETE